jgi:hypothetical protein
MLIRTSPGRRPLGKPRKKGGAIILKFMLENVAHALER